MCVLDVYVRIRVPACVGSWRMGELEREQSTYRIATPVSWPCMWKAYKVNSVHEADVVPV